MIAGEKVLGLILARAGSKGLPGKNLRDLGGKPLIAWSIDAGRQSARVDDVVVSTDGEAIAAVARQCGADVPFLRPPALATDEAASIDAVEHAVDWLNERGRSYGYLVLLEPTSPLREASDVDRALEMLAASDAGAVVSVCRADVAHPSFMYRIGADGRLEPYLSAQPDGLRRQDIEPLYYLDGTVYVSRVDTLRSRRSFYHEGTVGYEVPKWKAPEIDDEVDFMLVEAIMRHRGISG
jgi:CMP-N,N'-diacetyllegionaminic acid synthase